MLGVDIGGHIKLGCEKDPAERDTEGGEASRD